MSNSKITISLYGNLRSRLKIAAAVSGKTMEAIANEAIQARVDELEALLASPAVDSRSKVA